MVVPYMGTLPVLQRWPLLARYLRQQAIRGANCLLQSCRSLYHHRVRSCRRSRAWAIVTTATHHQWTSHCRSEPILTASDRHGQAARQKLQVYHRQTFTNQAPFSTQRLPVSHAFLLVWPCYVMSVHLVCTLALDRRVLRHFFACQSKGGCHAAQPASVQFL